MKRFAIYLAALMAALAADAQSASVLSSGRWWKVDVEQDGIYRLLVSDVPELVGQPLAGMAVYGGRGGMLSSSNSQTPIGDLRQVATEVVDRNSNGLFDSGDEIRFYGEGPSQWTYDPTAGTWLFTHHAYATTNSYYLTSSASTPLRISTATPQGEATGQVTTHTAVAHIDNELVNLFESGQLWMGEKLNSALPTRTFTLRLPAGASNVKLRYAVANKAEAAGIFTLSTTGFSRQTSVSSAIVYSSQSADLSVASSSYNFTLSYQSTDGSGRGYLDYIELTAQAPIAVEGGQTIVRSNPAEHTLARHLPVASQGLRVWNVTRAGAERELAWDAAGWVDSAAMARKYVLFDGTYFLSPRAITALDNQNLHGGAAADLVIVSHPDFTVQAERLAALHELFDGITSVVVTDRQVFNEFSTGQQDPLAIRSYLRWLKRLYPGTPPRYLILFGKGTYDNRNILGGTVPTVVTYETVNSFDDNGLSYSSDSYLGYLAEGGSGAPSENQDVSVGRLPARNTAEAELIVDKLEGYITRRDLMDDNTRGDWRNYVALLADDADPGKTGDTAFAHSSETVAESIGQLYPQINVERFYADAYHQTSGAIGSYYPDLNNALRQRINYGCLLLNYIGHGSTAYIGTERYIETSDLANYSNTDRLPLLVTSTCSYGRYDLPGDLCGAEASLLAPAAMISVISASRPISHVERFNRDVVLYALDPQNTIGDALRKARNQTPSPLCIGIIGDPALRLSQPGNHVRITQINQQPVDDLTDIQAQVLSKVTVCGEIVDSTGTLLPDFDGRVFPVVYDRKMRSSTLANDNPGTEVSFWQQKNILYRGSHPVVAGKFEYSFIVPMDVSYNYDYARLSHYAKSATDHAAGAFLRLKLGGMSDSALVSHTPPQVRLFMGDSNFRSGAITGPNPTLIAMVSDSAGINIGSGLGHDITAVLDNNPNTIIVLNDLYESDIEDGRAGSVRYTYRDLSPGRHSITFKVWNIFGYSATASTEFVVRGSDTIALADLRCVPNPARTYTDISLRMNTPERISTAEIQMYNTRGQMVALFTPAVSSGNYIIGPVRWDVSQVPPGLYIIRMIMTDDGGEIHQETEKCIVY